MLGKRNLANMLGLEYPFIQGAMANIANGEFAAAVCNAGALGIIASGGMHLDSLKENIDRCRSLTDRPFGVNIVLKHDEAGEMADLLARERVPVITTGAGNPGRYMEMWKDAGSIVFPVIPSVALAQRMIRCGADGVVAEGTESGGHVGELGTMALVPQVVGAIDAPVVAAGGIASGAQFLAALALGAIGIQMGTCLLVSAECPIHDNYKQAILRAHDIDTIVTGRITGLPLRQLKNRQSRLHLKSEKAGATRKELEHQALGAMRKAVVDGDVHDGSLVAGQVAGQLHEIRPLHVIFEEIYHDARILYEQLGYAMACMYGTEETGA